MYTFALISGLICVIAGIFGVIKSLVTVLSMLFDCNDDDDNSIEIDDSDE